MEHEHYLMLREQGKRLGLYAPESKLRKAAREHANESCRLAIRQQNELIEV